MTEEDSRDEGEVDDYIGKTQHSSRRVRKRVKRRHYFNPASGLNEDAKFEKEVKVLSKTTRFGLFCFILCILAVFCGTMFYVSRDGRLDQQALEERAAKEELEQAEEMAKFKEAMEKEPLNLENMLYEGNDRAKAELNIKPMLIIGGEEEEEEEEEEGGEASVPTALRARP